MAEYLDVNDGDLSSGIVSPQMHLYEDLLEQDWLYFSNFLDGNHAQSETPSEAIDAVGFKTEVSTEDWVKKLNRLIIGKKNMKIPMGS